MNWTQFFGIAALVLFAVEAWRGKSLVAAGLACLTAYLLLGGG